MLVPPSGFSITTAKGRRTWLETVELPWRDNQSNISCIPPWNGLPPGEYHVEARLSPKFGWCYWVQDVPNRSWILAHRGNVAGDTSKGYKTHSAGCIMVGSLRGRVYGQPAVIFSVPAVAAFMAFMQRRPFTLQIHNLWEV